MVEAKAPSARRNTETHKRVQTRGTHLRKIKFQFHLDGRTLAVLLRIVTKSRVRKMDTIQLRA